ncbi:MAG: oligosaccharide repeat unit polymerase [Bacteroides sp.]|nr:oligosaccharide repeat unit polymerase [Bacteroides sp.]
MNSSIWMISGITLLISYKLFSKAAGTLNIRYFNTITYVFYYSIILSTFIGSILCAYDFGEDHWILSNAHHEARIKAWLAVCYSMIAMPIGMILLNNLFKVHPKRDLKRYISEQIQFHLTNQHLKSVLGFSILISCCCFLYIKHYSSSWPLYSAVIEHDLVAATEGRIDVRLNFQGIIHIKNLIGLYLVPLLSFFAYIVSQFKHGWFYKFSFYAILIFTLLILSYDTQKAPIIFYLIGFIIIRVLIKGAIPIKYIIIFVLTALLIMALLYTLFNTTTNGALDIILDPRSAMWGRMFISGYAGVPLSFEWFPNVITQPTWQIGFPEFILNLFDLPTTESARLLMLNLNPDGNLISSYYIAEAWANYGLIGVIIAPFIVGFNVQLIQIFLFKSTKNPLTIAFYAIVTTKWVVSSGFVNFLFFKSIIFSFLVYYLAKLIIYRLTIKI